MKDATAIPYARVAAPPVDRRRVLTFGLFACAAGVCANVVPAYFILCMLKIPVGSSIRPMVETAMIFLGSLGGSAVGVPLGITCLISGRRWWVGWVLATWDIALSLAPWLVSGALWNWVVTKRGFVMKP